MREILKSNSKIKLHPVVQNNQVKNEKKGENMKYHDNSLVISIDNLKKYFNEIRAIDDISFNIKRGEVYGLLGINGSGKTTIIKSILGLHEYDDGSVKIFGMSTKEKSNQIKILNRIGYVPEKFLLFNSLTPKKFFEFIISLRKLDEISSQIIIKNLFEVFRAKEYYTRPIVSLSKGNKQKIQIIAALIHRPSLLILDEPFSGLDIHSSAILTEIIKIHKNNGGAVLLSTHITEKAQNVCDRIGILNNGKILEQGTYSQLENNEDKNLTSVFLRYTGEDIKNDVEILKKTFNGVNINV